MLDHEQRNQILRAMGFASYEEYLESLLWDGIRKDVLARAKRECNVCRGPRANQVHRQSYDRRVLSGELRGGTVYDGKAEMISVAVILMTRGRA